jgi:hypothetical protein
MLKKKRFYFFSSPSNFPSSSFPNKHIFILSLKNKSSLAGHQWLTAVILATQEADISRIAVWSQPMVIPYLENIQHEKGLKC